MRGLFDPWVDTALRLILLGLVAGPLLLLVSLMIYVRSPLHTGQGSAVPQPLQFDHRHHVADDGIDCRFCHSAVESSSTAGFPSTATCLGCHAQIWMKSPLLDGLRTSAFKEEPIRWRRVYKLPEYVYFDHSIHVSKGVGCVTCHGRVDRMASVARAPTITMGWCIACHRDPAPHLQPRETVTRLVWRPPVGRRRAELGVELARRYGVLARTDCTTCHR